MIFSRAFRCNFQYIIPLEVFLLYLIGTVFTCPPIIYLPAYHLLNSSIQLVAVLFSIGGSVLVCLPLLDSMPSPFPLRSLWAIAGAFFLSTYVVYFQRQAENEDRLNIPLFLGFVGLFSMLLMWPGFFIARVSRNCLKYYCR